MLDSSPLCRNWTGEALYACLCMAEDRGGGPCCDLHCKLILFLHHPHCTPLGSKLLRLQRLPFSLRSCTMVAH